jgi:uncharacterized protein YjiS (DUF1127 family)
MTIFEIEHSFSSDRHHSRLSRLGQNLLMRLAELQKRRKLRGSFAKLPEKVLRDISLTRHDVQVGCGWSPSRDAVDGLCKTAGTRVGNW